MNIFYLSTDPVESAQYMVDKHVVKMILESAQLLCTAHRVLDGHEIVEKSKTGRNVKRWKLLDSRDPILYSATHVNHPSAVWVREAVENYNWLYDHFHALGQEYTYRYGKRHKCFTGDLSVTLSAPPHGLREFDFTTPPSAMDKKYIVSTNPIDNYRNYYRFGKSHIHSWKHRNPPDWI